MLLNRLWIGLFLVSMTVGLIKLTFLGDTLVFKAMVDSIFETAKLAFEIALFLTGALCFWMGVMEIGEKAGAVRILSKAVAPFFNRLFPEIPKNHPAFGSMMMNFSANMLGLDNAATPLGLKAMNQLQDINPKKDTASNAQIMFLVLNTSGLTIIPVSIFAYRSAEGSVHVTDVFLPILFATYFASLIGLIAVSIKQKINLFQPVILLYLGAISTFVFGLLFAVIKNPSWVDPISNVGGNLLLFGIIVLFILMAVRNKVNVYDVFIEGAKGGFTVAIKIIPFLVAILVAIGVFKASGAMELLFDSIKVGLMYFGFTALEFIDALPVAFMKPFSGGAARGMMVDIFQDPAYGPDSFVGFLASTFQGSTETTFYVLAVYFGSVGVKKTRYAAGVGLLADFAGIVAAIIISYIFFADAI